MFVAIIGSRSSGCSTVENYLTSHRGFTSIHLASPSDELPHYRHQIKTNNSHNVRSTAKHLSFLTFDTTPLPSPSPLSGGTDIETPTTANHIVTGLTFKSPAEILDYVTRNWRLNFVTTDLKSRQVIETFIKRPFFLVLSLDAPLLERYRRSDSSISLENFVAEDDDKRFGSKSSSLNGLSDLVNIRVVNDFSSVSGLHAHIESLDLLNPLHTRPDWDMYFMTLASLASQRSNCMKRRVGAILVRDRRIVATGYNGTPRGVKNCNEGGCIRCNGGSEAFGDNDECVCLHAEENALLEAGRERVGKGSVLYCNTCPCLKCTVKIIQTGVECVVYNLSYKVDAASAKLFGEAGVQLRRFDPAKHRTSSSPSPIQEEDDFDTSTIDMSSSSDEEEDVYNPNGSTSRYPDVK